MAMSRCQEVWLIVFLGVMSAMAPLSTDMYLPALPTVQADLGISASMAQLTLTMTLIGMAVGQIFMGPVSDRYGRKLPLLAGMILFTIATAGCVYAQNIGVFLVFRFVAGVAGASGVVIARAIARDVCEGAELTRFFAILMMVNGLAPIIAPVFGGQILLLSSWRGVFVVLVIVGILQAAATLIYKETLPLTGRIAKLGDSFRSFPQLLRDRYFLGHCLLQCFIFGAFFSYLAGSSFVFQNIYAVSPQVYSLIFGGIGIGLLLIGMLPARLAGRVPDVVLLKYSVLIPLAGALFLLAGFLTAAPIWYAVLMLFITVVPLSVTGAASFSFSALPAGEECWQCKCTDRFFFNDPRRGYDAGGWYCR